MNNFHFLIQKKSHTLIPISHAWWSWRLHNCKWRIIIIKNKNKKEKHLKKCLENHKESSILFTPLIHLFVFEWREKKKKKELYWLSDIKLKGNEQSVPLEDRNYMLFPYKDEDAFGAIILLFAFKLVMILHTHNNIIPPKTHTHIFSFPLSLYLFLFLIFSPDFTRPLGNYISN